MEFGCVDSLDYIELDIISENSTVCEPLKPQKHVTFAPFHEIHHGPIYKISTDAIFSSVQPISILKETDYKYSKYKLWLKKCDDYVYLFLIFMFVLFFEKSFRYFS